MREILFRGKRKEADHEWVEGFYAKPERKHYIIVPISEVLVDWHEVDPATIGQYTGLKDRNGQRIFDGDIVRFYSTYREEFTGANCVVEYGVFNCSCCDGVYGWEFKDGDIRNFDEYKIIGNIHDNPELMKGDGDDENA